MLGRSQPSRPLRKSLLRKKRPPRKARRRRKKRPPRKNLLRRKKARKRLPARKLRRRRKKRLARRSPPRPRSRPRKKPPENALEKRPPKKGPPSRSPRKPPPRWQPPRSRPLPPNRHVAAMAEKTRRGGKSCALALATFALPRARRAWCADICGARPSERHALSSRSPHVRWRAIGASCSSRPSQTRRAITSCSRTI